MPKKKGQEPISEPEPEAPPSPPINVIHVAAAVGVTVLLAIIMRDLASILKPFFVAVFLSILVYPVGTFFAKYRIPRGVTYLVIIVAFFALLYVLGALISVNVTDFINNLPLYESKIRGLVSQVLDILSRSNLFERFGIHKGIDLSALPVTDYISLEKLANAAGQSLGSFVGILADTLVVIFFMIFILLEVGKLPERVRWAYGPVQSVQIIEIGQTINKSVIKYLGVVTLINFLLAAAYTVILASMGEDFAILWGVLAFLLNFIPYIGSYVAVFLPVLTALVQFSAGTALVLLVALIGIQVFLGNFVQPRIMGRHLNLSPLVVLISLAFWGWLWGIAGMFLAVPITATIKIVLEHVSGTENIARLMSEGAGKEEDRPRKLLTLPDAITRRVRLRR